MKHGYLELFPWCFMSLEETLCSKMLNNQSSLNSSSCRAMAYTECLASKKEKKRHQRLLIFHTLKQDSFLCGLTELWDALVHWNLLHYSLLQTDFSYFWETLFKFISFSLLQSEPAKSLTEQFKSKKYFSLAYLISFLMTLSPWWPTAWFINNRNWTDVSLCFI